MLVTFSGLDGSGKTTLLEVTEAWLQSRGFVTQRFHMVHWATLGRLAVLLTRLGLLRKGAITLTNANPRDTNISRGQKLLLALEGLIRSLTLLFDAARFRALMQTVKRRDKVVVLCDRYIWDLIIQMRFLNLACPCTSMIAHSFPKPDLELFVEVSPGIAMTRCQDSYTRNYFEAKAILYQDLVKPHAVTINNESAQPSGGTLVRALREVTGMGDS